MADNELGDKDVTTTIRRRERVKNTYHISIRRNGARQGKIDKDTAYESRKAALEVVMALVDANEAGNITGSTIYRQKYESWSTWEYDEDGKAVGSVQERFVPTFLDPVLSMKRTGGIVRWRDVSSHPDAAYLKHYERGMAYYNKLQGR